MGKELRQMDGLMGKRPSQIVPSLLKFIQGHRAMKTTVAETRHGNTWIQDIRGNPSIQAIAEVINL
jgi:hypothetical protein